MTLDSLPLKNSYRSDKTSLIDDFYIPCLKESAVYNRAVGYFTSGGLAAAAKGLFVFLEKKNSHMNLIASPQLSSDDIYAIKAGYQNRDKTIEENLITELDHIENEVIKIRLGFLAWLIAEKKLDIKIAYLKNDDSSIGIFHEKLGVFQDTDNNIVAFSGSPNETMGGLYSNYEAIDVFLSWKTSDSDRASEKKLYFEKLWNNNIQKLNILPFPEAVTEKIMEYKPAKKPHFDPESSTVDSKEITEFIHSKFKTQTIKIPARYSLYEYQRKAIKNWFNNDTTGLMKMATGTGKTVTALAAATHLYNFYSNKDTPLAIIVVCPYQHLVTQWTEEARDFGFSPIQCYVSRHRWLHSANSQITLLNSGIRKSLMLITTSATFQSDIFQNTICEIQKPTLLIADEVHNLGSEKLQDSLPPFIKNRLGLSATPERWFDEKGTQEIFNYFGEPIIEYGLKEAIENEYLTPYDYHPVLVPLTEEELEEYLYFTKQIVQRVSSEEDFKNNDQVKYLLIKRARLTASAENKLKYLEEILKKENISKTTHNLIYCGDGRVDSATHDIEMKQINAVTRILGHNLGLKVVKYVAETPPQKRKDILTAFKKGTLQGLVAIRCLDEGVNVRATKRAFILASSTNPRQFIQRRGRVLRLSPETGKQKAQIWDFLVFPPYEAIDSSTFNTERNMIKKELKRVTEFTKLARNGPQAQEKLLELKKQYNLLHL